MSILPTLFSRLIFYFQNKYVLFGLIIPVLISCQTDHNNTPQPNVSGIITTWAGTGQAGFDGDGNSLKESSFYWPMDLVVDPTGTFYIVGGMVDAVDPKDGGDPVLSSLVHEFTL